MQTPWKPVLPHRASPPEPGQLTPTSSHDKQQRPLKRPRIVKQKHISSSSSCITCRQRRLKCDETRPACLRCFSSKRQCRGYDSWEIAVGSDVRGKLYAEGMPGEDLRIIPVSEAAMNQTQGLSVFLSAHYRDRTPASPFPAHQTSFLHFIARHSIDLPLLSKAIDALCIGHLARSSSDQRVVYKAHDSQSQLLILLQRAIAQSKSSRAAHRHKDILASILVLSILPSSTLEDGCSMNSRTALSLHFKGAMQYLQAHGPAVFDESDPFDLVLLRHVRMQGLFQHLGSRTRALWSRPGWKDFDNMPFAYIPGLVMSNFVAYLPGLLERADAFVSDNHNAAEQSSRRCAVLMKELDDLQTDVVLPWLHGDTCTKPSVLLDARQCNNHLSTSARESLVAIPHFAVLYDFSPSHGSRAWCNTYVTLLALVADCTLLKLIHFMQQIGDQLWCDGATSVLSECMISVEAVEKRAYAHASEICQYVHFFSSRSLPAVVFMIHLLRAARNFFECAGFASEAEWTKIHVQALMEYVSRLAEGCQTYILCPVGELIKNVPPACYYKI